MLLIFNINKFVSNYEYNITLFLLHINNDIDTSYFISIILRLYCPEYFTYRSDATLWHYSRADQHEKVDSYRHTRSSSAGISTRPEFMLRPTGSLGSLLDNKSLLMIYPYLCSYRALYRPEASLTGP